MPASNSLNAYGSVTRTFHWLTALLIITAFPLGLIANQMAYDTGAQLAAKAWLFSLHKTVGIAAFTVALLRILWALTQPKPGPAHPDRRAETFLAEVVHWLLYASMLVVPLSGWLHHAATQGFAPILWPLGQGLPLVPTSEALAGAFAAVHFVFTKVLALSIFLHVAGALKHAVVDRDGVLACMVKGTPRDAGAGHGSRAPILAAAAIYALGLGASYALSSAHHGPDAPQVQLAEATSEWTVEDGTLQITVQQLGAGVTGSFADWTAAITFSEDASEGSHGNVTVEIAVPSLTLGSVTAQALEAEFFDAAAHPTARFTATILPAETGYVAEGTLALRGATVPVALPFTLALADNSAEMSGNVTLDRRDFGMGAAYPDESTVGFSVTVAVQLTATRAE